MEIQVQLEQNQNNNNIADMQALEENVQMEVMENWVPRHLEQPQDTITFNQLGSTANYLRATGPDIHLSAEEVLASICDEQINSESASSDDSGVVTSVHSASVTVPDFVLKACQKLPIGHTISFSVVKE